MSSIGNAPTNGVMPRACRNCRQRKVRCNRAVPCSNCVASNLECCGVHGSTARAPAQPQLAPVGSTDVEARLGSLEDAVRELVAQGKVRPSSGNYASTSNPSCDTGDETCNTLPEGASSFSRQTLDAAGVRELVASATLSSSTVTLEVENLRNLANNRGNHRSPGNSYRSGTKEPELPERKLPPVGLVLEILRVLREAKGGVSLMFTFYGIRDYAQVEDIAKRVYFPIDPPSAVDVTLLCGMLGVIFRELIRNISSDINLDEVAHVQGVCERNFYAGAETYDVMAVPSHEHVMILCLAMVHARDQSKMNLEWTVTSTAARHCLCLGYHREDRLAQLPPAESEFARRLFWYVYLFDKNFSCRLGRASIIQDYDIDASPCVVSEDPGKAPWHLAFNSFIELSRIHGEIFEKLYSASASRTGPDDRQQRASRLAARLHQWYEGWQQIDVSRAYDREIFESSLGPVPVNYYSILTLCHRGANLSTSAHDANPACYDAAHRGLMAHLNHYPAFVSSADRSPSYSLRVFYYTSFTPFVVTFLHCIAHTDQRDLQLLKDVVDSLEACTLSSDYT